jgi:hypothetical protein
MGVLQMRETVLLQILDPFNEIFDVSHTSSRHGSNAGSPHGFLMTTRRRLRSVILLGYLMLGEKEFCARNH